MRRAGVRGGVEAWVGLAALALCAGCGREPAPSAAVDAPLRPAPAPEPAPPSPADAAPAPGAAVASSPEAAAALLAARPYRLVVPAGLDRSVPAPLIVFLHGYGASAERFAAALDVPRLAADQGFVLALPSGTRDRHGRAFWNATAACCDFDGASVDDVAYLAALIDDAASRAPVDRRRVYVVGFSNGGFMAHRLACDLSDRVAGIASIAGSITAGEPADRCRPAQPVTVIQVHGDADDVVAYGGGHVLGRVEVPEHASAAEAVARWARLDGCRAEPAPGGELDLEDRLAGPETVVTRYEGCRDAAVELWTVRGGSHFVAQGRRAMALIVERLEASHFVTPSRR